MRALSVRQPWAWLIVNGWKPVENRDWSTSYRGPLAIHAGLTMTRQVYQECRALALEISPEMPFPDFAELERGGIVGTAWLDGCVTEHLSRYFFGPYGFVMTQARPVPFIPCKGHLGYFDVQGVPL